MKVLSDFKLRNSISLLVVISVYLFLLIRLLWFVHVNSVSVLFWDQWDFLGSLFEGKIDLWEVFSHQHGPHRQGLGGLILAFIYPLSDWNVRFEAFLSVIIMAVSCWIALMIKKRILGNINWSDAIIPFIYFSLLQFETFIGTPNLAHGSIPVFLVTFTAYVLTLDKPIARAIALAFLVFFSTYTGFAIFSGFSVIFLLLIFSIKSSSSKIRFWNIFAFVLSLLFFGSFFINYHHAPAVDCFQFPHEHPFEYVQFSIMQFGTAFGFTLFFQYPFLKLIIIIAATFLFLALLFIFLFFTLNLFRSHNKNGFVIFYLTSFTLLFIAFAAIGRVCLGVEASHASRYVTYATPGILALYFTLLIVCGNSKLKSQIKTMLLLGFFVLMIFKEVMMYRQRDVVNWYVNGKKEWVNSYLEYHNINYCDSVVGFKVYPDERRIQNKIEYLESNNLNFFKDRQKDLNDE